MPILRFLNLKKHYDEQSKNPVNLQIKSTNIFSSGIGYGYRTLGSWTISERGFCLGMFGVRARYDEVGKNPVNLQVKSTNIFSSGIGYGYRVSAMNGKSFETDIDGLSSAQVGHGSDFFHVPI
jgi:hypothetical protein